MRVIVDTSEIKEIVKRHLGAFFFCGRGGHEILTPTA